MAPNKSFLSAQKSENDVSVSALVSFLEAFNKAPVGIIAFSIPDTGFLFSNAEAERIIGLAKHQMAGRCLEDLCANPETRWACRYTDKKMYSLEKLPPFKAVSRGVISRSQEMRIRQPGGNEIWVINSMAPIYGKQGRIIAVVTFLSDIDEKVVKVEKLRKSKEVRKSHDFLEKEVKKQTRDLIEANRKLETVLNTSSDSIWVCDGEGTVLSINRASERLLHVNAEDVVGKNVTSLVGQGLMDRSVTMEVIATRRQVSMMQYVAKTKKSILVTGTPVIADDGTISMVIINERDLTRLNELREELQRTRNVSNTYKQELTELNLLELRQQEIIAKSKEMQQVLTTAMKLANLNVSTILVMGESGTGKGLLTKFIHARGKRKNGPFVQINCAALPESLLEAELFGYEKGAFTGAREQGKAGLFEMAEGGTLFLDEIGELALPLQAKLLKCLEEKEIMRLGGLKPIKIQCTIIAATNINLSRNVRNKTFRKDLFFRLNTFTIHMPSLRKRPEDIFEMVHFFLAKYQKAYGVKRRISSRAMDRLLSYKFPGNARELKNTIKKAVVMSEKELIDEFIEGDVRPDRNGFRPEPALVRGDMNRQVLDFEKNLLIQGLEICKTTRSLAAHLGISQSAVVRKLKKYKLTGRLNRRGPKKSRS